MSSGNPILPGGGGNPPSIAEVVSNDDLQRFAGIAGVLKELASVPSECSAPGKPMPLPVESAKTVQQNLCAALRQIGVPSWIAYIWSTFWAAIVLAVAVASSVLGQIAGGVVGPLLAVFLTALDGLRKGIDPAIGILAVGILQELLGSEFDTAHLPVSTDVNAHIARAGEVGALLTKQLIGEFAPASGGAAVPSSVPAERFTGFAINFGVATGILAGVGGLIPWGHVNELRELGEEVARNIGLGRLVRQALRPLVRIMVEMPYTWYLNQKYTPTQFSVSELVNPYTATLLGHDQLYAAMNLLGYSNDKIDAFVKMHQKKLSPAEVLLLVDNALWTQDEAEQYIETLGWPPGWGPQILAIEEIRRERGWYEKLVSELESEVRSGRISMDEFEQVLNGTSTQSTIGGTTLPATQGLPFSPGEKNIILATVNYKVAATKRSRADRLSEMELADLFEAGLLTASDLNTYWTARGLPEADQNLRMLLILLRLSRATHLAAEKQQHYQAQLRYFVEKQTAKPTGAPPPVQPIAPFPLGT